MLYEVITLEATNRSTPTGGVIQPMARFVTMITPKKTGSIPSLTTIGTRIGVRMVIAADAFRSTPTMIV